MSATKYGSFSEFQEANKEGAVTEQAVRRFLVGKAGEDAGFRKALLADPAAAVEAEIGIQLPSELKLVVHEETNDDLHLVLPAALELTPAQMQAVSGGWPPTTGPSTADDAFADADGGVDWD